MQVAVEELKLHGGVTSLGLEAPLSLAATLQIGPDALEGADVQVDASCGPSQPLVLLRNARLKGQLGGHMAISLLARGLTIGSGELDILVADVQLNFDPAKQDWQTTCVELQWDTNRGVWVSGAVTVFSSPAYDAGDRASGGMPLAAGRPTLVLTHRSHLSELPSTSERRGGAVVVAERFVADRKAKLVRSSCTNQVEYPGGIFISLPEPVQNVWPSGRVSQPALTELAEAVVSGSFLEMAMQIYKDCDQGLGGFLTWDAGEPQDFIAAVMQHFGLERPSESQLHSLFVRFAGADGVCLDARECICLADALARQTLALQAPELLRPPAQHGTTLNRGVSAPGDVERQAKVHERGNIQKQKPKTLGATLLSCSTPIARLVLPGFDPHGWLRNPAIPPGLGKYTLLEVANLFLDGVAEQLGLLPKINIESALSPQNRALETNATHSSELSVSDLVSPASQWAPELSDVPAARTSLIGAERSHHEEAMAAAVAKAVEARTVELELTLDDMKKAMSQHERAVEDSERHNRELSMALARSEDASQLSARRCEDLQQESKLATAEAEGLRNRLEVAERRSEMAEDRVGQLRSDLFLAKQQLERIEHAQTELVDHARLPSPEQRGRARAATKNGHDHSNLGRRLEHEKSAETLYCLRSIMRRILLAGFDSPVIVDVHHCDTSEMIEALRRHLAFLWRTLRSLWDAQPLLHEVISEAAHTPLAVASLAASGEPPWPEAVVAPRAREAEQLLEVLRSRSAQSGDEASSFVVAACDSAPRSVPQRRHPSSSGSRLEQDTTAVDLDIPAQALPASSSGIKSQSPETTEAKLTMSSGLLTVPRLHKPAPLTLAPPTPPLRASRTPRDLGQMPVKTPMPVPSANGTTVVLSVPDSVVDGAAAESSCAVRPSLRSARSTPVLPENALPCSTAVAAACVSRRGSGRMTPREPRSRTASPSPLPTRSHNVTYDEWAPPVQDAELAVLRAAVAQRDAQIQELEEVLSGETTRHQQSADFVPIAGGSGTARSSHGKAMVPGSLSPPPRRLDGPPRRNAQLSPVPCHRAEMIRGGAASVRQLLGQAWTTPMVQGHVVSRSPSPPPVRAVMGSSSQLATGFHIVNNPAAWAWEQAPPPRISH